MDLGIKGRSALVCAASKGLGYACADALAREGVNVAIVARTAEPLELAAKKLREMHKVEVQTIVADVGNEAGVKTVLAACPSPDILVNNAGGPPAGDFRKFSREDWIKAFDLNMLSAVQLIAGTIDKMTERKFGRIVNITSSAMRVPMPILPLTNGARGGLTAFVAGMAGNFARDNVTINNILPGPFDTDRLVETIRAAAKHSGKSEEETRRERLSTNPARRAGNPEELGAMCAFLCSNWAGYITGQNILIDGGAAPTTF